MFFFDLRFGFSLTRLPAGWFTAPRQSGFGTYGSFFSRWFERTVSYYPDSNIQSDRLGIVEINLSFLEDFISLNTNYLQNYLYFLIRE